MIGVWRSLVAYSLGVRVVGRSNRLTPTTESKRKGGHLFGHLFLSASFCSNNYMVILVSNDDGIHSEGLLCLEKVLSAVGKVYTVAPDKEQSASSHSLTLHRPLRINKVGPTRFSVDGTPTDCINLAVKGFLPVRPDLVVSGINKGPNLGDDVTYSGTVAAAFEASLLGIPALAVSLVAFDAPYHFQAAAEFAAMMAKEIISQEQITRTLLNINVPNRTRDKIRGYRFTKQGKRRYGDKMEVRHDPRGKKYYWIGGDNLGFEPIDGSDCVAVDEGYISVTPLRTDFTDDSALKLVGQIEVPWSQEG